MNNRLNEYIEYLYVTGELDRIELDDLIRKYNNLYGELPEEFFDLDELDQKELLEQALRGNAKIIKK